MKNFLYEAAKRIFLDTGIPEILGFLLMTVQKPQALGLKIGILSFALIILGCMFLYLELLEGQNRKSRSIISVWYNGFLFLVALFNIIHEDHVMNKSHRLELFILTIGVFVFFIILLLILLIWGQFKNGGKTDKILKMNSTVFTE